MERGITKYDKSYADLFHVLQKDGGVEEAHKNAAIVNQSVRDSAQNDKTLPYHLNPYTDVHLLLNDIDNFAQPQQ